MVRDVARDRHSKPDFEKLLREAEAKGWRVSRDNRYFKCLCPCAEKHWVKVVLSPSSSRSLINTRKEFERKSCWKEAQ